MLFKTNDEKFSLGRVKSKKICRHPGGDVFQSSLEVGHRLTLTLDRMLVAGIVSSVNDSLITE